MRDRQQVPIDAVSPVKKYLSRKGSDGRWQLDGCTGRDFRGAVVIPSLAEECSLFATLESLARNPAHLLERFLVVVVVNNRAESPDDEKVDNLATLQWLEKAADQLPVKLSWVDAASRGRELPSKGGGVGMARRVGHDLALERLDYLQSDPLLISLDADTLVGPEYLSAITTHFANAAAGGAIIPFRHQEGKSRLEQDAIERYELFLRSYVLGLHLAGSPYAFHTVGSAMACRASAYVKMGGMNNRMAGEDFYFLQQLHRTSGVSQVSGTIVFPSARPSNRVPFGTGRSVSKLLDREPGAVLFYRPGCFRILAHWLQAANTGHDADGESIFARAAAISPELAEYLDAIDAVTVWDNLRRNNRDTGIFLRAFHGWFDGLKTMKLVHHLSDRGFPRCEPDEALPELLEWLGEGPLHGVKEQLAFLRERQSTSASTEMS